jgi:hypothetical protein
LSNVTSYSLTCKNITVKCLFTFTLVFIH